MLTREQILNMPAGREMDALVAEKVMGWTDFSPIDPTIDYGVGVNGYRRNYATDTEGRSTWFPFYSTDISAAWEAVDKSDKEVTVKKYEAMAGWRYWCRVSNTDPNRFDEVVAHGKTAAEAICKSALLTTIQGEENNA